MKNRLIDDVVESSLGGNYRKIVFTEASYKKILQEFKLEF